MVYLPDQHLYWRCSEEDCAKHVCSAVFCKQCRQYWCHRFFHEHLPLCAKWSASQQSKNDSGGKPEEKTDVPSGV